MGHRYKERFERDRGFRIFRDKCSILLQAQAFGKRLTDREIADYCAAVDSYLDAVTPRDKLEYVPSEILPGVELKDVTNEPLFKYVDDKAWGYIQAGSFRFGTAMDYRASPHESDRDQHEGAGHFALASGDDQATVTITSGFNCAIFCGTSYLDGVAHSNMLSRHGLRRIKIEPVAEFINEVAGRIDAIGSRIHDVIYTNRKVFKAELPGIEKIVHITGTGNLTERRLRQLNRNFFDTFYRFGFVPSLYMKPATKSFMSEHERRIVFELQDDIKKPAKFVRDRALLKFVTLID